MNASVYVVKILQDTDLVMPKWFWHYLHFMKKPALLLPLVLFCDSNMQAFSRAKKKQKSACICNDGSFHYHNSAFGMLLNMQPFCHRQLLY